MRFCELCEAGCLRQLAVWFLGGGEERGGAAVAPRPVLRGFFGFTGRRLHFGWSGRLDRQDSYLES